MKDFGFSRAINGCTDLFVKTEITSSKEFLSVREDFTICAMSLSIFCKKFWASRLDPFCWFLMLIFRMISFWVSGSLRSVWDSDSYCTLLSSPLSEHRAPFERLAVVFKGSVMFALSSFILSIRKECFFTGIFIVVRAWKSWSLIKLFILFNSAIWNKKIKCKWKLIYSNKHIQ